MMYGCIQVRGKTGWIITGVIILLVIVFGLQSNIRAVAVDDATNVLKVSPVRTDIQVAAGTSKAIQTTVTNLTKAPIAIKPVANDFISADERGTPALILDEDKYAQTHSLKRFMQPFSNVTIPAGQAKIVDVVITVPANTPAGGYFGAVRFAPTILEGGGQVNLSASVASLILLTVPGEATEKLELTDFTILQRGKSSSYFYDSSHLEASVRFENKGNIQVGPFGKVSVKKNDKVIYETDFNNNDPRDMTLPDSARRWEIPLSKIGGFGNYTVVGTFTYGQKNQTLEVSESFWVIPPTAVMVITVASLLVLVSVVVAIWLVMRRRRRKTLDRHNRKFRK